MPPVSHPFNQGTVIGDYALIWPNPETGAYDEHAIDLAPECVRFFAEHFGKTVKNPRSNRSLESAISNPFTKGDAHARQSQSRI